MKLTKIKLNLLKPSTIAFTILSLLAIIWVIPVLFAVFTSFKSENEIRLVGFSLFPQEWTIQNFIDVLENTTNAPLLRWFMNSIVISVTHTFLVVIIVSLTAYGYSRMHFKGRDTMFWILMVSTMLPSVVGMIPLYRIIDALGWVNSIWACIIPGLGGVGNIFLVRQFMKGIPVEFDEAARMEGATDFQIYSKIMVPLTKPILTVVALFSFTGSWNDFLWPTIVFNDVDKMTVTAGLQTLKSTYGDFQQVGRLMSSTILALVPTLIIFLIAQKYFIQSMSLNSGVKG